MDLGDFMREKVPLPAVNSTARPVMLSVDTGDVLDGMSDEEAHKFVVGLGGILAQHFNIPADGEGGMNEIVAFATAGSPMMFGEALLEENSSRIDNAQNTIRSAQKSGALPKDVSIFLSLAIR